MVFQSSLFLVLHVSLLLLFFLLAINNTQEIVAFGLGLSSHHGLSFLELTLAGNFEFVSLALVLFFLGNFFSAFLALSFLKSTLCSKSIDFGLTVGSLLLHFSETCNFEFLFFFNTALFVSLGSFAQGLVFVVTDDVLLFINFLLTGLLLF